MYLFDNNNNYNYSSSNTKNKIFILAGYRARRAYREFK